MTFPPKNSKSTAAYPRTFCSLRAPTLPYDVRRADTNNAPAAMLWLRACSLMGPLYGSCLLLRGLTLLLGCTACAYGLLVEVPPPPPTHIIRSDQSKRVQRKYAVTAATQCRRRADR